MTIINKTPEPKVTTFGELNYGDCFVQSSYLFQKLLGESKNSFNAVRLIDGMPLIFDETAKVIKAKTAELTYTL